MKKNDIINVSGARLMCLAWLASIYGINEYIRGCFNILGLQTVDKTVNEVATSTKFAHPFGEIQLHFIILSFHI